jgi:exopolyphosphatase/guanosine-5'-triphosphate,3'-diphosphate pyrophosphatase
LGRDTFSGGVIRPKTADATFAALEGFRHIIDTYKVQRICAVATSAVREARNSELFLDRVRGRTGLAFDIINEAEESRLVYLAARDALRGHAALRGAWTLLVEVGGGSTSLMLLRRGRPNRSGVYALGAVRLRQVLDLRRHTHELQVALLKRSIANVVEEIAVSMPLERVTQVVAIGGDVRLAAAQILEQEDDDGVHEIPGEKFLAFCDEVERLDDDGLVNRFRLPVADAETLLPALLVYRALLAQTAARQIVVSDASLRAGMLLDLLQPGGRLGADDFEGQVLASAEAVGHRFRFDRAHGHHVAMLATRLFDELRDEHGCRNAIGCCCRPPASCMTSAFTSACARITSIRNISSPPRRFSGCPTTKPRWCPISRAITADGAPSRAICRTSPWIAATGSG